MHTQIKQVADHVHMPEFERETRALFQMLYIRCRAELHTQELERVEFHLTRLNAGEMYGDVVTTKDCVDGEFPLTDPCIKKHTRSVRSRDETLSGLVEVTPVDVNGDGTPDKMRAQVVEWKGRRPTPEDERQFQSTAIGTV